MISNYTISLEDIIQTIWDEGHPDETHSIFEVPSFRNVLADVDRKIEYAVPYIFSFDYEYYGDANDKLNLEKHILKDYYTRNICCDSFARWLLFLEARMDDIMPRYKALWNAQAKLIAREILEPYHLEETRLTDAKRKKDSSSNSSATSSSNSSNDSNSSTVQHTDSKDSTKATDSSKFSNMPQAAMMAGNDYLTNMTVNANDSETSYDANVQSNDTDHSKSATEGMSREELMQMQTDMKNENYSRVIKGSQGRWTDGRLIKDYQDVILNIENMISKELNDLFYLIY